MLDFLSGVSPQMKLGMVLFLAVAITVVVLTVRLISATNRERLVESIRKKQLGMVQQNATAIINAERQFSKDAVRGQNYLFEPVNPWAIARDMRKAGLPPFPPIVLVSSLFMSFLIARFILNVPFLPLYVQAMIVFSPSFLLIRYTFMGILIDSRKMKSLGQLILFTEYVQRAIAVGASADDAVSDAILETEKPLRESLNVVKDLLNLGYDFQDAVSLAADQVDLPEFDVFAAALSAQSNVGGSVSNVLKDVVEIARSGLDLKKKVATMTAEGRINAILLGSLPIALSLYLRSAQPDYFNQIWEKPLLGSIIFFGTLGLASMGCYLAVRISKISG